MIRVTIELHPHGDSTRAKHMGTIDIANDGTGTAERGNYNVCLSRMDSPVKAWRYGAIKGFNRRTRGPHDLLLLALLVTVGTRNGVDLRLVDQLKQEHGLPGSRAAGSVIPESQLREWERLLADENEAEGPEKVLAALRAINRP